MISTKKVFLGQLNVPKPLVHHELHSVMGTLRGRPLDPSWAFNSVFFRGGNLVFYFGCVEYRIDAFWFALDFSTAVSWHRGRFCENEKCIFYFCWMVYGQSG